jgi:hypothetical protein
MDRKELHPGNRSPIAVSEDRAHQARDLFEVAGRREKLRAVLHRLGGDPYVVGRDRSPLTPELQSDSRVSIGRPFGQGDQPLPNHAKS